MCQSIALYSQFWLPLFHFRKGRTHDCLSVVMRSCVCLVRYIYTVHSHPAEIYPNYASNQIILQTQLIWKLCFHNSLVIWGRKLMWTAKLPSFLSKSLLDIWVTHTQELSPKYCEELLAHPIQWKCNLTRIRRWPGSKNLKILKK